MLASRVTSPEPRACLLRLVSTHGNTELSPAAVSYVRDLMQRWLRGEGSAPNGEPRNKAGLAKAAGVSKTAIGQILEGRNSIGAKVATGVGALFGLSFDEVKVNGEREFAAKFDDQRIERPERYPNRAAVLSLLRAELDPEVVTRVESQALASPVDPPKTWWIRTVLQVQEAVRLERDNPLAVAAARSESEAMSDEVNRKIEERRAAATKPSKGTKGTGGSR